MAVPPCTALLAARLALLLATARGEGCSGFGNVFTEIPENSAHGSLVARLPPGGDAGGPALQLCLAGADAAWFYLDGRSLRLNASAGRALDREELESPVLMVALTCAEDGFAPVEYRVIVQVLNENDNRPRFRGEPVLTHNVSELVAVHSVVFSTQAEDADGDLLMYVIDTSSPDARFFRIDLPNSGRVVLARALDFESRQRLEVVVTAVEMNTKERFNASARVRVNVLDGDDQYPRFLPCAPPDPPPGVCISPVYTANVTEGELTGSPLRFSPGSIYAEDGDRGLRAAISYSLLAGEESGRFHIDNASGAITLLRPVESSRSTPSISLSVMASQVNDATKYAVAVAVVRVLAPNRHPPRFALPAVRAFVPAGAREAALVTTFGGRVLALRAHDPDFPEGINPKVRYSLRPRHRHGHGHGNDNDNDNQDHGQRQLFQLMPNGLLVARADRLRPAQTYSLQVLARDEESGETSNTTVELEVLWPGQAAPRDPSEAAQGPSSVNRGVLGGALGGLLLLLGGGLLLLLRAMKRRQRQQQSSDRAALAMEKHPNVSLRWFQPVPAGKASSTPPGLYSPSEGSEGGAPPPPLGPPPPEMPARSTPNGVLVGPPLKGPPLCRTGSLGALPPPPSAAPPAGAVRRSASSPRLDAPPQQDFRDLLPNRSRAPIGSALANQSAASVPANQEEGSQPGDPSKEPRLARVPPTPSRRTPPDAAPPTPPEGPLQAKPDAPPSTDPRPRRSYQAPVRDEESESQRKARSRLMRQSRRSTQGVTLTELKEAEKAIGRGAEREPIREGERRDQGEEAEPGSTDPSRRPRLPPAPPPQVKKEDPEVEPRGRQRRKTRRGPEGEESDEPGSDQESPPKPPPPPQPPAFDYQQLHDDLWLENERLKEQLQETELKLTQIKLELERVTQSQERIAERPALLELERFERRALERKAAELEEELKALQDLRADNQRLKDENAALIRVISKLSK